MTPIKTDVTQSRSLNVLNSMFEEYQFLRNLTKGMRQRESFWCYDKKLDRHRNIQIYHCSQVLEPELRQLSQDLKKLAKVNSPNLINIHDTWVMHSQLYAVLDYVDTPSIMEVIEEGRFGLRTLITISLQLTSAIEELHKNDIFHGCITPQSIHYARDFIKISPPLIDKFMLNHGLYQLRNHQSFLCPDEQVSPLHKDLYSIGAIIFLFSTGYGHDSINPDLWKDYGVIEHLEPVIKKLLLQTDTPYNNASELTKDLTKIKSILYPEELPKENAITKLLRFGLTRRVTEQHVAPIGFDTPTPQFKSSQKPSEFKPGDIISERFHIKEILEKEHFDIVYRATDVTLNHREVNLHFFFKNDKPNWQNRLESITSRISQINHPHISQILERGQIKEGGYMVCQREDGEKLQFFSKRHNFTYPDIIEFCHQMIDAAMASSQQDLHLHYLNLDNIYVYKHNTRGYYYRTNAAGYGNFISLMHSDEEGKKLALNPITLAPELYKNDPQGERTFLFVLGQLAFRLLASTHPCENLSLPHAHTHLCSQSFPAISDYRQDLPSYFQRWLKQMMQPDYRQRFSSLQSALIALKDCPAFF